MAQMIRGFTLLAALTLGFPASVHAHMEMSWPYSFRSRFNPVNTDPDYSNTSPLAAGGSNYPCKGYQNLPGSQAAVTSYTAGQAYNLTIEGSASHGGGSCQISLSYDNGQTFRAIKSIIGGCSLDHSWQFTVPDYAPPSQSAILAWTWFNRVGNREMYMQCARVAIEAKPVRRSRRTSSKRQSSINELPEIFKCNIGNGCETEEDHRLDFPVPGNIIEYRDDSNPPLPGPGYKTNGAAPPATSYAPAPTPSPQPGGFYTSNDAFTSTYTSTNFYPSSTLTTSSRSLTSSLTTTTPTPTPTTFMTVTAATTTLPAATPIPTLIPAHCTPGAFTCNSSTSWSQCVTIVSNTGGLDSTYIYMGLVAAGMQCTDGKIIRANTSS